FRACFQGGFSLIGRRRSTIAAKPEDIHKTRIAAFFEKKRVHLLIQDHGQIPGDPGFQSANAEIVCPFGVRNLKGVTGARSWRKTVAVDRFDSVRELQRGYAVCAYVDDRRLVVIE